jgi:LysR family glycine cleavage system transcriptional activator
MPPMPTAPPVALTAPSVPSLENLRCFLAAAQSPTFRAAARVVALTPAALSQRIRQLEDQLGARLFERTTRSVSLTTAGLALVPASRAALDAAAACVAAARGDHPPIAVELTVGTRMELGLSLLVANHDALAAACPGLTLNYFFGSGPELLSRVRLREIDCAVTSARFSDAALGSIPLHHEEYVFVGARELLRRSPFSRREQAAQHTLLDIDGSLPLYRYWQEAAGGGALKFGRVWRVGAGAAIRELVLQGRGVAVLPRYMLSAELKRKVLVPLFPAVKARDDYFRLIFRQDDPRRSVFETLARALLDLPLR